MNEFLSRIVSHGRDDLQLANIGPDSYKSKRLQRVCTLHRELSESTGAPCPKLKINIGWARCVKGAVGVEGNGKPEWGEGVSSSQPSRSSGGAPSKTYFSALYIIALHNLYTRSIEIICYVFSTPTCYFVLCQRNVWVVHDHPFALCMS